VRPYEKLYIFYFLFQYLFKRNCHLKCSFFYFQEEVLLFLKYRCITKLITNNTHRPLQKNSDLRNHLSILNNLDVEKIRKSGKESDSRIVEEIEKKVKT
jgi:hypothetical protein